MAKIICDVCGATYTEMEEQCPICGTAKSNAPAVDSAAEEGGYAYVKGGRFSKGNVKKHGSNQELPRTAAEPKPKQEVAVEKEKPARPERKTERRSTAPATTPVRRERKQKREEEPSNNIALVIIAIILVMAIVAICAFLVMKWLENEGPGNLINPTTTAGQQNQGTQPTGTTNGNQGPVSIPCTGLRLPVPECTFANVGDTLQITPILQPENTTETVMYIPSDERIATVDENGIVTAVANGQAVIYVYCGSFKVELTVICNVGVEPDEPTEPTNPTDPTDPTEPTEPPVKLELNRTEFTLRGYGSSWNVYSGSIDRNEIVWTSSNEEVATVTNGKVVAVGNGVVYITAEYAGQKVSCKVICADVVIVNFTLSRTEFTIAVGDSYKVEAYDANGLKIDPSELKFYVTDAEGFFSVDENGKVTGLKNNMNYLVKYKYLYVEYNGEVIKCIVYVKDAA